MSEQNKSDEQQVAFALANRLLDEPNCDPDDDLRTLARQLTRRHEEIGHVRAENNRMRFAINKALEHLEDPDVERVGAQCTLCFSYRAMLRESLTALKDLA